MTKDRFQLVTIGDRVRYLRETVRNMTSTELAKQLGIAVASLSQLENGSTKAPSAENLLKLTLALKANPFWIITGEGDPEKWPDVKTEDAASLVSMFNSMSQEKQAVLLATCAALHNKD